jgi:hypothetical protein
LVPEHYNPFHHNGSFTCCGGPAAMILNPVVLDP